MVFSGSVSNSGDTILTNVFVVSSQPSPNTPLLGPIELAPGETKVFSVAVCRLQPADCRSPPAA
jgi:hypothetical protein